MKRLNREASSSQFDNECSRLGNVSRLRHPNIVQFLGVFLYQEDNALTGNLLFPMAIGDLEQVFKGSINQRSFLKCLDSLWSQFEGLASGLQCLHDQLRLEHRDIQPSNILLYQHTNDRRLVAKLADFGLARDLKWVSRSRSTLIPPYYRDVWKLGTVFAELLTYLLRGSNAVKQFHAFITVTYDRVTSDTFKDLRYNENRVKPEVLEWLRRTPRHHTRGKELPKLQ